MNARALILTGFGINCDGETQTAFEMAGAEAMRVHLNDLIANPGLLDEFGILAVPGGFSFGDDVASGKIFANRLRFRLGEPLLRFVQDGNLVIGICNGFQVLVKMGLLPLLDGRLMQQATLTHNDSSRFENRWVYLKKPTNCDCVWLQGIKMLELPIRHGEGKFIPANEEVRRALHADGLVALQYATRDGATANGRFPQNPNGAVDDIAGICDRSGRVFGLMPHPEAFLHATNHPRWSRESIAEGAGLRIFENAVAYIRSRNTGRAVGAHPS